MTISDMWPRTATTGSACSARWRGGYDLARDQDLLLDLDEFVGASAHYEDAVGPGLEYADHIGVLSRHE
jgi:hypothetical protein